MDITIRDRAEQFENECELVTKRCLEDLRKIAWEFVLESSNELTEVQQWAKDTIKELSNEEDNQMCDNQ